MSSDIVSGHADKKPRTKQWQGFTVLANGMQPPGGICNPSNGKQCDCINFIRQLDKIIAELIRAQASVKASNPHEIRGFEVFWRCGGVA